MRSRTHMVVTGGAGFIGSHLCDALLELGHRVTCVDNLVGAGGSTRNIDHLLDTPSFQLEMEDVVSWAEQAKLEGVACVFHLAASKMSVSRENPERDLVVNALGTLRVLQAAARDGVGKFVHASTGSVVGETALPHSDDSPTRPVSHYGASKLAGEAYCRAVGTMTGLDWTVVRYYHVIGPRQDDSDRGGVVPIFARTALQEEPLTVFGDGRQTRSFTSVHDAVSAALLAFSDPRTRATTLTCASGIRVSVQELAEFVIELTGSCAGIRYAPPQPGDIQWFNVDNSALRRLGLRFRTDWQGMVREVVGSLAAAPVA